MGSPPSPKVGCGSPVFFPIPRQSCVHCEPSLNSDYWQADLLCTNQMAYFCLVTAGFFCLLGNSTERCAPESECSFVPFLQGVSSPRVCCEEGAAGPQSCEEGAPEDDTSSTLSGCSGLHPCSICAGLSCQGNPQRAASHILKAWKEMIWAPNQL